MLTTGCGPNGDALSRTGVAVDGLGTGTQTAGLEATGIEETGIEATAAGAGGGAGKGGRELSAVHPIDNDRADTIDPSFTLNTP
jgi:hypothetical protein